MIKEFLVNYSNLFTQSETICQDSNKDSILINNKSLNIQWKVKRDYSEKIYIDIKCQIITQYDTTEENTYSFDGINSQQQLYQQFFQDLNRLVIQSSDRLNKKIHKISLYFETDSVNIKNHFLDEINDFLVNVQNKIEFQNDLELHIFANYNWDGVNITQITENIHTLKINDIYSYLPLSNFKFPKLKNIIVNEQNIVYDNKKFTYQSENMLNLEKYFSQFINQQILIQLERIIINGNQYPQLIKVFIQNLINVAQPNLKRIEFSITLDPSQFHLILSINNLSSIYKNIQVCLNYNLDFALLNESNIECSSNNELIQQLLNFPYLFKSISHKFQNKDVNLIFKNLKNSHQLELFDRIRSHSDQVFISDSSNNLKQLNHNSLENFSSIISNILFTKYSKNNNNNDQILFNQSSIENYHNNENLNNSFLLSQQFLAQFIKIFTFKTTNYLLNNMFDNSVQYKIDSYPIHIDKSQQKFQSFKQNNKNLNTKKQNPFFEIQSCTKLENQSPQNNTNQQCSQYLDTQENSISKNIDVQKLKSIIQKKNTKFTENLFSTYFLSYNSNEVNTIELMFENTVFGNNYKELFIFISQCVHLKKLTLLNFCYQENFNGQTDIDDNLIDQSYTSDKQKVLQIYSSVFQSQPKKQSEKVISDLIQSLRKLNLLYFRFSTNINFSFNSASRILQMKEKMVHFSLKDFSSNLQQPSNGMIPEASYYSQQEEGKVKLENKLLVEALTKLIDQNQNILSFSFKNTNNTCIQSKKEFQQVINQYLNVKKILVYQIYASKYLLHSEIIKRKEIFNHLLSKFFINTNNIQVNLNKVFKQINY